MAFTEFYVQSTGSNLNAGSTTDNAAVFTYAAGTFVRSTGVFTVASENPLTDGVAVGDWASIYTTAGATVATFVARVTARGATTITVSLTAIAGATSTVDESAGAATCKIGGAWAGPAAAVDFPFDFAAAALKNAAGNYPRVNYKAATYTITAGIVCVAGLITHEGYTTTAGDGGRATFASSAPGGTGFTQITLANDVTLACLSFAQAGATAGTAFGLVAASYNALRRVVVSGSPLDGFALGAVFGVHVEECEAYENNTRNLAGYGGFKSASQLNLVRCIAHDNTGANNDGFIVGGTGLTLESCIADRNGRYGVRVVGSGRSALVRGCVSYKNGSHGFYSDGAAVVAFESCISERNTGYGFALSTATPARATSRRNCKTSNNTGGATLNFGNVAESGNIDDSTDCLADMTGARPTTGDFTPTGTAIAAGRGSFTQTGTQYSSTTTSVPNIGVVQTAGTGGSSGHRATF